MSDKPQAAGHNFPILTELFESDCPLEIEIGCGNGKFSIALAEANPSVYFLGIDWSAKRVKIGEERVAKKGLKNIKFVRIHAHEMTQNYIPPRRVACFHIYFPDPWPKRRHQGRRLVNAGFLSLLYDRLKPRGRIKMATDHLEYFAEIKKAATLTGILWGAACESKNQRLEDTLVKTNYEMKYEAAGKDIYYLELEKS